MASAIKIGVLGAGRAEFSLGLVRDLCLASSLYRSSVTFTDVDEGRRQMVHALAQRYACGLGTGLKVVGLCHGFYGYQRICETIGVPASEIQWEAPGVNHWIYLTTFRHQGRDLYPLTDEWIETKAAEYWRTFRGGFSDTQPSRAAIDRYRGVGLMRIGDASRTFSEWYYHTDLGAKRRWYGHRGVACIPDG